MSNRFRLLSLVFFTLVVAPLSRATYSFDCGVWFNHPIVTNSKVVIGWKNTNAPGYKQGGSVPKENIDAIKHYGTDLPGSGCFGGSFKVYSNGNRSCRGYINVKVVGGVATQVTFTTSALYRIFS